MLTGVDEFLHRILPFADTAIAIVAATRLVPMAVVTLALWALFLSLTPDKYAGPNYPKWPGAVLTAAWWYGTLNLLPVVLAHVAGYDLTYGSLAGVMITLIFFFLVGLGVVIGAELNAAFAEVPEEEAPVNDQNDKGKNL
jgi:membrane protein